MTPITALSSPLQCLISSPLGCLGVNEVEIRTEGEARSIQSVEGVCGGVE